MARKLNTEVSRVLAGTAQGETLSTLEPAEIPVRSLAERRDKPLELTPELATWFTKMLSGPYGPLM